MSNINFKPINENIEHVKPKTTKKVEEMLKKGRRYFGSSGASFTEQAFKSEWKDKEESQYKLAAEIVEAEREYTKILKDWIKDKPNAILIDSVYTPQEPKLNEKTFKENKGIVAKCYTSHIMIIGDEVFIIDSFPFKKKKKYSLDENEKIYQSNNEFEFTEISAMPEKFEKWINYYHDDALLTAIVGFTGEEAYTERYETWFKASYRLLEQDRYTEFLDQKYEVISEEDKQSINPNLVAQTIIRCVKPFDRYENVFNAKALATFK